MLPLNLITLIWEDHYYNSKSYLVSCHILASRKTCGIISDVATTYRIILIMITITHGVARSSVVIRRKWKFAVVHVRHCCSSKLYNNEMSSKME